MLSAASAQAQWATVNTVSNPPGAFTITCTDFPIPSAKNLEAACIPAVPDIVAFARSMVDA